MVKRSVRVRLTDILEAIDGATDIVSERDAVTDILRTLDKQD